MNDLTGQRFGRLLVICRIGTGPGGRPLWDCKCDCAVSVVVASDHLRRGYTKSCGCLQRELAAARATKHGHASGGKKSKVYDCWRGMKKRCTVPSTVGFENYGGRGIKVCDRWLESFENFLADMGEPPSPDHSIDRIDNNGNYEPANCRWATVEQQGNNRRTNEAVSFGGETLTIAQWAKRLGLGITTLHRRLSRGWPLDRALSPAVQASKSHKRGQHV